MHFILEELARFIAVSLISLMFESNYRAAFRVSTATFCVCFLRSGGEVQVYIQSDAWTNAPKFPEIVRDNHVDEFMFNPSTGTEISSRVNWSISVLCIYYEAKVRRSVFRVHPIYVLVIELASPP